MAWAQSDEIVIDIIGGVEGATPIAVVPFGYDGVTPLPDDTDFSQVIAADLARTGEFNPLPPADMVERPSRLAQVQLGLWRRLAVDYLVIGHIEGDQDGVEKSLASISQRDSRASPFEQQGVQVRLQALDELGHRRLTHTQTLGGPRHASSLGGLAEGA